MIRTTTTAAALAACLLATALSAETRTYPNSIKYKDTGVANATAVTAVASIEARALLNRDDTTDVEVTTGSFEGDTPSGYVTKVKVGIPTADGVEPVNFNHPESPDFSGNISGVITGDVVSIDAQVRGLDNGTDHAVANATVAKRPDLGVAFVLVPTFVVKGRVARVRTGVFESNGQLGARADVRLLIDGVEVDRAENIWVNAGGFVSVAFAPVLEAENGTHDFTVVVEHVNPGDWDEANNTRTEPARVYDVLDEFYSWSATASEQEFSNYSYEKRSWREETRTENGVQQSFRFEGYILAAVDLNTLTATASGVSDNNPLFNIAATGFSVRDVPAPRGTRCATSRGNPDIVICQNANTNLVEVDINYGTGDATYRSWGWATRENPFGPTVPMFTWDTTTETHTLQSRFGSTVALTYTLSDATNHWTAEPFLASLNASSSSSHLPYRCTFSSFTQETICREQRSSSTTRSATVTGTAE